MRPVLAVLCSVAMVACAHGTVPNDTRADAFTGAVSGVVALPDSIASDSVCTQIAVYATTVDDKGGALRVGRSAVHQGRGRCSYEITDLPPGVALTVHVDTPSGMTCGNGTSLAFAADNQESFSLKDNEGRTRDFRPQCSAATSSR
jgi:hypothetical protein